jgi:hypothetical protein
MFTKPLLLAALAACGVHPIGATTGAPSEQPDKPPPEPPPEEADYIFCCQDVDHKSKSGDGCVTIGEKQIDQCSTVLACTEGFTKQDGKVICF